MQKCAFLAVAMLAVCGMVSAAELQSGLPKGEFVPAFTVTDVTGPAKGESLCYRCKFGNKPVVSIFAKEVTPEVAQLTKAIDGVVAKNKDAQMSAFMVLMTAKPGDAQAKLADVAAKNEIKNVPLTTFDGASGPAPYKINPKADVTVMMWVDSEVKVSKGFSKADLTKASIEQLVADTKSILE